MIAVVAFEGSLGLWLLAGVWARVSWAVALGCFGLFACVSVYKGLAGETSCGCFGRVETSPWLTAGIGMLAVIALWVLRPGEKAAAGKLFRTAAGLATAVLCVSLVALGIRGLWIMAATAVQQEDAGLATVGPAGPEACPADCLRFAVRLARAELGLEVGAENTEPELADASKALTALLYDAAGAGGKVEPVPLERLLEEPMDGAVPPVLLVHRTGHLEVLVGAVRTEVGVYYQVLHGEAGVRLASAQDLRHGGFSKAWRIAGAGVGVPVRVGQTEVRLDKIYHNFGELAAEQEAECVFSVANSGTRPVVMDAPTSSCGCVVASPAEAKELAPGDKLAVAVKVRWAAVTSLRHKVFLTFREQTGTQTRVALDVLACQRMSLKLSANRLDFGQVSGAKTYMQTVRLEEVPTDRFEVKAVDVGSLPLDWQIQRLATPEGLRQYRLQLRLTPRGLSVGRHVGDLRLTTTSRLRPTVTIPVQFQVQPPVRAIPSIVSVGIVPVGQPQRHMVDLVCDEGPIQEISVAQTPPACRVELPGQGGGHRVALTIVLSAPGIWREEVVLAVRTSEKQHRVVVPCVGFGATP